MMKRMTLKLLIHSLCLMFWMQEDLAHASSAPVLVAVLVGNNRQVYDAQQNLSHADDDVLRIADTLLTQLPGARISVLVAPDAETRGAFSIESAVWKGHDLAVPVAEPTMANLLQALDWMELETRRLLQQHKKVVVLFYFAGHQTTGGELHLQDSTLRSNQLNTMLDLANNRSGVLRLVWHDACNSAILLRSQSLVPNTQFVGTEEAVAEFGSLKGSILTSMLVTGLNGAAALPGQDDVTVTGLAQWLREQLSSYLKIRIEGPNTRSNPNGGAPLTRLDGSGVVLPARFGTATVQIWELQKRDAPRLLHTLRHFYGHKDRLELRPGTYRIVQVLSYSEFGKALWKGNLSSIQSVILDGTGIIPVRYYDIEVGGPPTKGHAPVPSRWIEPIGAGTVALVSRASRGDKVSTQEKLKALEKSLPGISSLEVTQVAEAQEALLQPDLFNPQLSPRTREGIASSFTANVYGTPDWNGPEGGSLWLCQSGASSEGSLVPECGLSLGLSRDVPVFYYDRLSLNLRMGVRYEASQRAEMLALPDGTTYTFYAQHGLGVGAGLLGRVRLGRILLGLEESLWWQPTTLWSRQQPLLQAETPGLLLRGSLESALSLKLRLGPLLQVGPRLSLVTPLGRPGADANSSTSGTGWLPEGYSESQWHWQGGMELTLHTP